MQQSSKGGATNPDVYRTSANAYNAALGATGAGYNAYNGLADYAPGMINLPDAIMKGMGAYQNPYERQVINRAAGDINRITGQNLEQVAAEAANAGAFGGSRHGLVEAETRRAGIDALADTSAQLRHSGFTTAADLASRDIANRMGAEQFNVNSGLAGANLRLGAAGGLLNAGAQAGDLSQQGFDYGRTITGDQMKAGTMQQTLMQAIMDGASQMFAGKTGQNTEFFKMLQAAVSGSPLNNQVTQTSSYKPGLFDYLSLGLQTLGSMYNPNPTPTPAVP